MTIENQQARTGLSAENGWSYSASDLSAGLRRIGIGQGDTVFFQICEDSLGKPYGVQDSEELCAMIYKVLRRAVGDEGTLLVPCYTFSFCRQELFDVEETPTVWGEWNTFYQFPEYFRRLPGAIRSADPIFSTAGLGPLAADILTDLPHVCLGKGCVHDRLRQLGGKICILGVGLYEAVFRHYCEAMAEVPWRFDKLFTGEVREDGEIRKEGWLYNVRIWASSGDPAGEALEELARETGLCRVAPVGSDEVLAIEAQPFFELTMRELARDPWFTAKGPAGDPVVLEEARVDAPHYDVALPESASMEEVINALWALPRDIVSSGYDDALHALASQLPMTIHEYPTGTECWTWIIPEKWTCHEAYLETVDGKRLFSYEDHPLHVVSHSLPFEGTVTRAELFEHLHVHPRLPDAIPFIFRYYERDWGLCCSKQQKAALTDEQYRVVIRSDFSYGTLKVGEVVVPGQREESIVLCAHLCHPHQANDDMTGVAVGVEVVRRLLRRDDLRYTYRFLVVPETIGSVAYLSHNEELIPRMKGGLFLEMLGTDLPHSLQLSFSGDTQVDDCYWLALKAVDERAWSAPFRSLILNDEVQFNAPGVRVPMLSLSRVLPRSDPEWPYRGYHSNHDTPEAISIARLKESVEAVIAMIETLEQDATPVNSFKGEVFCSRYGLHIDWYSNPEGNKALFDIMHLIDGKHKTSEIAKACGISFSAVRGVIDELNHHDLVDLRV